MSHNLTNYSSSSNESLPEDTPVILNYISQMLMEEDDLGNKPEMFQDCSALLAAEKSFFNVLVNQNSEAERKSPNRSRKKIHYREGYDYTEEEPSNKQAAIYAEESEQTDMQDKVLLDPSINPNLDTTLAERKDNLEKNCKSKQLKAGWPRRDKKECISMREVVDFRGLLTQCAQAVASYDTRAANDLLNQIKLHSSPYGDGTEKVAHYFANALEARMAGTGTAFYTAFPTRKISTAEMLKAYHAYATTCPFPYISNLFANKSIRKAARGATRVHIIDFGILYGFQWPCIIQGFSLQPGGPPKLRITGIDFPQPGFRPAERVEETGRRLANYCKRFNVPFKYNAIAKNWDTIQIEDLKIDRDEMLIVNCLYRFKTLADETVLEDCPRDGVLNLIRWINPDIFVHGICNGTYNTPFFLTRFREALHHFSTLFDMFEVNGPEEEEDRLLFEKEVFGREAMNVIACEGMQRVERPETYKQWQVRNTRAGFRQLPLNRDIMKEARTKLKSQYHKDYMVDEDSNWMLQGWKGRVIYALSCWVPAQD